MVAMSDSRRSIDLGHVPAGSLQLLHLGRRLALGHVALVLHDAEQHLEHILLGLLGAAEEKVALGAGLAELLPNIVLLLLDLVLHVHLLRGVARPGVAAFHDALLLVGLELVAVVVLSLGVAATEEQCHRTDLVALVLLGLPLLNIGTERSQACAEARHEDVRHLVVRNLHAGVRGVAHAVVPWTEEGQEAGAQAELGHVSLGLPVLADDQQLALSGPVRGGRADGVDTLLDRGHQLSVLVERNLQGLELREVVRVGARAGLLLLELLSLTIEGQLCDRHLLHDVHGIRHQLLQELTGRLAEEVQVLREQLFSSGNDNSALLLLRGDLLDGHHREGIHVHHFEELRDALGVVRRVDGQGLAVGTVDQFLDARADHVDLDVEGRAVVVFGGQPLPIRDPKELSLADIRPCHQLGVVLLLEGKVLAQVTRLGDRGLRRAGIQLRANLADVLPHSLCGQLFDLAFCRSLRVREGRLLRLRIHHRTLAALQRLKDEDTGHRGAGDSRGLRNPGRELLGGAHS
mmetsp:Transcript_172876/g.554284  ORF Transcript_172876/g.554284 Transcript_172876/m.554284 type:complete len:518 (-) Transcript_172876:57-1610(-)